MKIKQSRRAPPFIIFCKHPGGAGGGNRLAMAAAARSSIAAEKPISAAR
jgi:hypothetical protein